MYHSLKSKTINLFNLFPFCKNVIHLKALNSLLIVHGLIERKELLKQFLKACFHVGALDIALSTFNSTRKRDVFLQNLVIRGLSSYGLHEVVLSAYFNCRNLGYASDDFTFPFVIKACSALNALEIGKQIHCVVLRTGYDRNVVIQTGLVDFYAKNGFLGTARELIGRIPQPDLVSWNALVSGYSFHGYDHEALEVFKNIFLVGLKPNCSTLASVIPSCSRLGCLDIGRSFHGFAIKSGHLGNDFLVPALISMYASDGHSSAARTLFDLLTEKNVAVWNSMISAYMQNQLPFEAFDIFQKMRCADVHPDGVTFISVIPSIEFVGSISFGECFHALVIKHGSESHMSVSTALVSMYAKLGDISKSDFIFKWMHNRNQLSWNAMISGYVHNGLWDASLAAFCDMQLYGLIPDVVSIISVLSACSKLGVILQGKSAHAFSIKRGIESSLNLSNAFLAFYSDCNNLASAFNLFLKMETRNSVSWNTLISRCVHIGEVDKAVELLHMLRKEGLALDLVTLISILPMYCGIGDLDEGMSLHGYAIKKGFLFDISLVNALISMYCKCGDLDAGRLLFNDMPKRCIVSWNALIGGYRVHILRSEVLTTFEKMINEGLRPNSVTLLSLLPVCSSQLQGKSVHAFAIRAQILHEIPLLTSLMFMYARFEKVNTCHLLFEMSNKTCISLWNTILSVHTQSKNAEKAVVLFCDMLRICLRPDRVTVLSLISACAQLNSLKLSDSIMAYVVRKGYDRDISISNALIDMNAKCGNISAARNIFESMFEKDNVSWSTMINAYGVHGKGEAALELFSHMRNSGAKPDISTYSSILSACSHSGLVKQGWEVFNSMMKQGILPKMEHYGCIVDLLGRTGHLKEAYAIVKNLKSKSSISLLESLLGACKVHGDVQIGEKISEMMMEMDPENTGSYVMLASLYAAAGRWSEANRVRCNLEERQLRKLAGCSLLF